MAENSNIEWTDHTFNPWMGCTKVSPACAHCYAERDMDHRYGKVAWGPQGTRVLTTDANWRKPLKWDREAKALGIRQRVFCASLADVFEDWGGPISRYVNGSPVSLSKDGRASTSVLDRMTLDDVRARLFELIDSTTNLDWLLLTKRPENVDRMWPVTEKMRLNIWLGTSVENFAWATQRLPFLHAAKRNGKVATTFISAEPLVGELFLQGDRDGKVYNHLGEGGIDWVITGGESGPDARPAHSDWYRSLRNQCESAGVPFHFKQWGEWCPGDFGGIHRGKAETFVTIDGYTSDNHKRWGREDRAEHQTRIGKKAAGRLLDGVEHNGLPEVASC